MPAKSDPIRKRAEQLVTRVGQALLAGNRPAAVKLVECQLRGQAPMADDTFDKILNAKAAPTTIDEIWHTADRVFSAVAQNSGWRGLIGRMIKHCGKDRALEVLLDAERAKVVDPQSFIAAAIRNGNNSPFWKMDEQQLMAEAGKLGVQTHGKSRQEIERGIEKARLRQQHQGELGASLLGRA